MSPASAGAGHSIQKRAVTLRRFALAAGLCLGLVGPALADPAITTTLSSMRREPAPHSRIVQTVPANAQIDLQSCAGGWCYASWRNLFGWIPAYAVAQGGAPSYGVAPAPYPVAPPVVIAPPPVVVGPAWGYGWGHPYGWGGYGYGWRGY